MWSENDCTQDICDFLPAANNEKTGCSRPGRSEENPAGNMVTTVTKTLKQEAISAGKVLHHPAYAFLSGLR